MTNWPKRYFSGLSDYMKGIRKKEFAKRKVTTHPSLQRSNAFAKPKRSKWTLLFHKEYPNVPFNKNIIAKKTGINRKTLNIVYDRGMKAWKTSGSRPGATAQQWAIARVYKFVLVTKKKAPEKKPDPNSNLRRK